MFRVPPERQIDKSVRIPEASRAVIASVELASRRIRARKLQFAVML
jgi:hypothetical protein